MRSNVKALIVMMLIAAGAYAAQKQPAPAGRAPAPSTAPASTQPATGPATQPADAQAPKTWDNPPKGLEFLRTVPELRGVSLKMTEKEFLDLIKPRHLDAQPKKEGNRTTYFISTDAGENVIVMFRDGVCGIQRMMPSPKRILPDGTRG